MSPSSSDTVVLAVTLLHNYYACRLQVPHMVPHIYAHTRAHVNRADCGLARSALSLLCTQSELDQASRMVIASLSTASSESISLAAALKLLGPETTTRHGIGIRDMASDTSSSVSRVRKT